MRYFGRHATILSSSTFKYVAVSSYEHCVLVSNVCSRECAGEKPRQTPQLTEYADYKSSAVGCVYFHTRCSKPVGIVFFFGLCNFSGADVKRAGDRLEYW